MRNDTIENEARVDWKREQHQVRESRRNEQLDHQFPVPRRHETEDAANGIGILRTGNSGDEFGQVFPGYRTARPDEEDRPGFLYGQGIFVDQVGLARTMADERA